jgi:predicted nuclease of predicted toxin-antitoxin system
MQFDQNLSPSLPELLADFNPESLHVREVGLRGFGDKRNATMLYAVNLSSTCSF